MLTVWTDGSAVGNGKAGCTGGIGVFWGLNSPDNISESVTRQMLGKPVTNNKTELLAIQRALSTYRVRHPHLPPLIVVTDSLYCLNSLTKWYKSWRRNDWKTSNGKPVLNLALIQELSALLEQMPQVQLLHCNSHTTEPSDKGSPQWQLWFGNMMADKLARGL